MWDDIRDFYRCSGAFALALPLLFLIPAIPEFIQHVVEINLGMYDSRIAARAAATADARLGWGYLKTLALLLPGYWFVRYMAWGDARRAWAPELPALPLWLVLFCIQAALQAWGLFGPSVGALLGLTGRTAVAGSAALSVIGSLISIYFTAWMIAWPLGNASIGPVHSLKVMAGSFWRALGYMVAGVVPLMAAHYALGLGAIGRPRWLVWPMLTLDALVVALLALTIAGSSYVAARRAARHRNISLVPERAPAASAA